MVGDLFHYGHVRYLKRAKELYDDVTLVVGIHNDKTVESYKRTPVMTMEERKEVIEACRYVDEVYLNAPLMVTIDLLNTLNINIFVSTPKEKNEADIMLKELISENFPIKYIERTENISTTDILKRVDK